MEAKEQGMHLELHNDRGLLTDRRDDLLDELDEVIAITCGLKVEKARLEAELALVKEDLRRCVFERSLSSGGRASADESAIRADAEHLSTILVNLYVALERIHASVERQDVITAIQEVIVNQIGSEEFAIFERDSNDGRLSLASSIGLDGEWMPHEDVLREVLSSGVVYVRNVASGDPLDAPAACVPLNVCGRVTGVIAIHSLLCHKQRLEPLDHELCSVLSAHAGLALYAASLHGRSKAEGVRR